VGSFFTMKSVCQPSVSVTGPLVRANDSFTIQLKGFGDVLLPATTPSTNGVNFKHFESYTLRVPISSLHSSSSSRSASASSSSSSSVHHLHTRSSSSSSSSHDQLPRLVLAGSYEQIQQRFPVVEADGYVSKQYAPLRAVFHVQITASPCETVHVCKHHSPPSTT